MRKSGGGGALKIHRSNNGGMSFNLWTALLLPFFSVVTEIETIRAAFFLGGDLGTESPPKNKVAVVKTTPKTSLCRSLRRDRCFCSQERKTPRVGREVEGGLRGGAFL